MKEFDPEDLFRGWFIGDFENSVLRTKEFEVGYLQHAQGEVWPAHYHEISDEINYLVEGEMTLQSKRLKAPSIFVIEKGEIADPEFHTDCKLIVVKVPSVPGDKILIK